MLGRHVDGERRPDGDLQRAERHVGAPARDVGRVDPLRPAVGEAVAGAHAVAPHVADPDDAGHLQILRAEEDHRRRTRGPGRRSETKRLLEADDPVSAERRVRRLVVAQRGLVRARDLVERGQIIRAESCAFVEVAVVADRELPHPFPLPTQSLARDALDLDRVAALDLGIPKRSPVGHRRSPLTVRSRHRRGGQRCRRRCGRARPATRRCARPVQERACAVGTAHRRRSPVRRRR